jgi:Fe-S-cluster containining protein
MSADAQDTTADPVVYDCQSCGACCVVAGPVGVYPDDTQVPRHLTASVRRVVGFASYEADEGVRRMASDATGRCRALKGTTGETCGCGIYERRPRVCRTFQAGSDDCRESRYRLGLGPKPIDSDVSAAWDRMDQE